MSGYFNKAGGSKGEPVLPWVHFVSTAALVVVWLHPARQPMLETPYWCGFSAG